MRDELKIRGCILGGAVGDAFGYPVASLRYNQIQDKYGKNGLLGYDLCNGFAEISANTQMSLFTANGLLLGKTRGCMRGVMGPYAGYLAIAYLDWVKTQRLMRPDPDHKPYCWLYHVPELRHRRGANATCIQVLTDRRIGTIEQPTSHIRDCGAIARVAPIGAYLDPAQTAQEEIDRLGAEAAAITHGHVLGWLPAAALTHMISRIVYAGVGAGDWKELIAETNAVMTELFCGYDFSSLWQLLPRVLTLSQSTYSDRVAIENLGDGRGAESVLAIAILCAMRYRDDFEAAMIAAINHNGDSAAVGCVCGSLLGAMLGAKAIPDYDLEPLELYPIIDELARDLWSDCSMSRESNFYDEDWVMKYLEGRYESQI